MQVTLQGLITASVNPICSQKLHVILERVVILSCLRGSSYALALGFQASLERKPYLYYFRSHWKFVASQLVDSMDQFVLALPE